MSDLSKPNTITETYLAALTGDYTGAIPAPVTRTHSYLAKICENGIGSGGESADLTEVKAQIAALQTEVSGLESDMNRVKSEISALASDMGDVKTALESIVEVSE